MFTEKKLREHGGVVGESRAHDGGAILGHWDDNDTTFLLHTLMVKITGVTHEIMDGTKCPNERFFRFQMVTFSRHKHVFTWLRQPARPWVFATTKFNNKLDFVSSRS